MEDLECKGSVFRIKKCAFDFLSMEEDLIDDEEYGIWWELIERELRLKSTFLYCDLNHVILNSCEEQKRSLTDLANRFFHCMEELDNAVKCRSISAARTCYCDAVRLLQELMAALTSDEC
ncbi:hypothetical protein HPP92_014780 [Vanilla planifolia]|nr:hypothetical protein HPP92_014780 [Vanilla planifolia]